MYPLVPTANMWPKGDSIESPLNKLAASAIPSKEKPSAINKDILEQVVIHQIIFSHNI